MESRSLSKVARKWSNQHPITSRWSSLSLSCLLALYTFSLLPSDSGCLVITTKLDISLSPNICVLTWSKTKVLPLHYQVLTQWPVIAMPFKALDNLPDERLQETCQRLASAFGVRSIWDFQQEAGSACLLGFYTILNCPTGMGKTLAFYFVLFWHWNIGDTDPANERIVLIIGPLNALMQGQVSAHSSLPISSLTLGIGGDSDACRRGLSVH